MNHPTDRGPLHWHEDALDALDRFDVPWQHEPVPAEWNAYKDWTGGVPYAASRGRRRA